MMYPLNAKRKKNFSWRCSWLYSPTVVAKKVEKLKPVWNLIPFCSSFIYYLPCSAHVWDALRARLLDEHDMILPHANPAAHFPYGQHYSISQKCRLHIRLTHTLTTHLFHCIHVRSNATNLESCNISEREIRRHKRVCVCM